MTTFDDLVKQDSDRQMYRLINQKSFFNYKEIIKLNINSIQIALLSATPINKNNYNIPKLYKIIENKNNKNYNSDIK